MNTVASPVRTVPTARAAGPLHSPVVAVPTQSVRPGTGAAIDRVLAPATSFDPFIMADHFRMWEPTFQAHPHAGFSAVTYLFEDSETGFRNRDSMGRVNRIEPGDLHWTMAGAGIVHEEFPLVTGRVAHGLQMFVNLPASHKLAPPASLHRASAEMPRFPLGDAQAKLVFGSWPGQSTQTVPAPGDATLVDIRLPARGRLVLAPPAGRQGVLLVIAGRVRVAGVAASGDGGFAAYAVPAGAEIELEAGDREARLVWLSGSPWREPLVMQGPFGMSDAAQVTAAIRRYQAGEMGRLAPLPLSEAL
jgi:redox-sensitive bicupin YhaK (pirin superfamily)